jgi:hypothetical protein
MKEKFLRFKVIEKKPKTNVYLISNKEGCELGTVCWYSPWRKYVSIMFEDIVIDSSCHKEIGDFLDKIMEERK